MINLFHNEFSLRMESRGEAYLQMSVTVESNNGYFDLPAIRNIL